MVRYETPEATRIELEHKMEAVVLAVVIVFALGYFIDVAVFFAAMFVAFLIDIGKQES